MIPKLFLRAWSSLLGRKITTQPVAFIGALSVLLLAGTVQTAKALPNHPGGFLKESDLERIRYSVASGLEPWASAYAVVAKASPDQFWTPGLPTGGVLTDSYAIQNQGNIIWKLTVKWVVTGDIVYANAAKNAINKWVNLITDMKQTSTLRTGIGGNQMANAAEILAYGFGGSAGWSAADIAKAQAWFKNVPYKAISGGVSSRTGNWGTSALAGCMAMAIFCDDQTMFDYAVNAYKLGFKDTTDGNCGVTQYIDATGEAMETGRDQGHVQGGMAHLMEVALMAWNQNLNLVTYTDATGTVGVSGSYGVAGENRLFIGHEYDAKYNLGGTVSYHPFLTNWGQIYYPNGIAPRAGWSPIWEMANHLWIVAGFTNTYTSQVLDVPGYVPEYSNGDHVGLGTLCYRTAANLTSGTYKIIARHSGKALSVVNHGRVSGTSIEQRMYYGGDNQRWVVTAVGTGEYQIVGVESGKALNVDGMSKADGTNISIWPFNGGNNQTFTFTPTSAGYFRITPVHSSGSCIDVKAVSTANGADINMWTYTEGNNQQWILQAP